MKTVDWGTWGKAALIRGVRTFAEAMLAYIGTGALVLGDVNWVAALSAGGFGFIRGTDQAYIDQILDYTEQAEHDDAPDSAASVCRRLDSHYW